MKTKYGLSFTMMLLIFISFQSNAQWFPVNHDTTFYNNEIFFLNADTGFVVGANYSLFSSNVGAISRTKDGGITWDTVTKTNYIPTIYFPSVNTGYCGGHDGTVFKTIDMGNSWNFAGSMTSQNDYSNCFFFNRHYTD